MMASFHSRVEQMIWTEPGLRHEENGLDANEVVHDRLHVVFVLIPAAQQDLVKVLRQLVR